MVVEFSIGVFVMSYIKESNKFIFMLVVNNKVIFLKKVMGCIIFICVDGFVIKEVINKIIVMGEG